jgi:hypothetical protein
VHPDSGTEGVIGCGAHKCTRIIARIAVPYKFAPFSTSYLNGRVHVQRRLRGVPAVGVVHVEILVNRLERVERLRELGLRRVADVRRAARVLAFVGEDELLRAPVVGWSTRRWDTGGGTQAGEGVQAQAVDTITSRE